MRTLCFEKWEGLGNDFVLIEAELSAAQAISLCDRRRGIGADGVLLVSRDAAGHARMTVWNADGSHPEMCGNGLRCVAGYLTERTVAADPADRHPLPSHTVEVLTDAGLRRCQLTRLDAASWSVAAAMGQAQLTGTVAFPSDSGHTFTLVDVGNPHAVTFAAYREDLLDVWGPAMQNHLDGGINVELCRVKEDGSIDVLVWERGVGRTQACGTGACAVAAAAAVAGLAPYDQAIEVHLPGGPLSISVTQDDLHLTMQGPARRVYSGEISLPSP